MSQFYDQASLVMVPSGYKAGKVYSQKPLSTDGELTFTRNSNATRVNADGLVEKVRTNEVVYSQDFTQTAWTNNSTATLSSTTTVTPAGTTDAVRVTSTAATQDLRQIRTITSGLPYTNSAYIRRVSGTGTVRIIEVNGSTLGITPTSEWQRFSITSTATSTTGRFYIRLDTSGDSIEVWGCQMEISDFGPTDYIATTSAAVSVGPTANVPRLNYSNGCPSLLLEPQRTNLCKFSEQLSNAVYFNNNLTVNTNAIASPDGYSNADMFTSNDSSQTVYRIYENAAAAGQSTGTVSAFMKYANHQYCYLSQDNYSGATQYAVFDLINGTNTFVSSGYSATITPYANGWYRVTLTGQQNTIAYLQVGLAPSSTGYAGTSIPDGQSAYFWGLQREYNAAYATSYIPTLGASVTRLADDCEKTSTTVFGASATTMFMDITIPSKTSQNGNWLFTGAINGSNFVSCVQFDSGGTNPRIAIYIGGAAIVDSYLGTNLPAGRYKFALMYKNGSQRFYINGTEEMTWSASFSYVQFTNIGLNEAIWATGNNGGPFEYHQVLIFPKELTQSELAEITAL